MASIMIMIWYSRLEASVPPRRARRERWLPVPLLRLRLAVQLLAVQLLLLVRVLLLLLLVPEAVVLLLLPLWRRRRHLLLLRRWHHHV